MQKALARTLVGLATTLGMFVAAPAPADACNIKLIGANHSPRRAVARSSRPSNVLVVGDSPRLKRELKAKGHNVEVVDNVGMAKRHDYGAVVTDQQHERNARKAFGTEHVVVRSGDIVSVVASVESTLARRVVAHGKSRNAKDALVRRTPKAAGGGKTSLGAPTSSGGGVTAATVTGTGAGTTTASISTGTTAVGETKVSTQHVVQAPRQLREQIYFGLGSTSVGRKTTIARAVKWLGANAGSIIIEGHADPSGSPEANMVLSQQRADAVKDAIVSEGIDASRIEVQAFGDTKLEYGRTDGRNRRVTIKAKP
jgi:peptidoglycan-associated lipoprotein